MVENRLEKTWRARYERRAAKFSEEYKIAGWSEEGLARRLALVQRAISSASLACGSLILDLGSGPGTYTRALNAAGYRCVGLDYSWNVIQSAKQRRANAYLQGEAYELPFRNSAFDAVICIGVLQTLANPNRALEEMARVLAPGAHLFLDGMNSHFWLHRLRSWRAKRRGLPNHLSYYSPSIMKAEAELLGFDDVRISWLSFAPFCQAWLPEAAAQVPFWGSRFSGYAFLLQARKGREAKH